MDETKQPGINFEAIFLKEIHFIRSPKITAIDLSINFHPIVAFSDNGDRLVYELQCEAKDKNESFNIKCSMIGIFSVNKELANMNLKEFSKINAPALVIPYIREIIANTTVRAGLSPLILQPINVAAIQPEEQKPEEIKEVSL